MASVRYLVNDVDEAVEFYPTQFGFKCEQQFGPAMAILSRGGLILQAAGPTASAAKPMPDGRRPEPGGWNRFVIQVADLPSRTERMRQAEVAAFRNEIVKGPGGRQILCEDPSGNAIALFQPA